MSIADYAARKYDYLAFRNVSSIGEKQLGLALYSEDTSGQICVGIQKLAQRWALEFLTEAGSMLGLPDRGCAFLTLLRRGSLRTQSDVIAAFATANLFITRSLRKEEYADMPDDERFDSAELTSVALLPGYMNLSVMVNSVAGDARAVILPIETLP
jgi:hypothetical protein